MVDGTERVVVYDSKVLTKPQVKWPTYDKELWAVVHAIRRFRQYTVGAKFVVVTDHKPLANIPNSIAAERDGTGRRGRWAVELTSFDFDVRVKAGSGHRNADALSRRPPVADADCRAAVPRSRAAVSVAVRTEDKSRIRRVARYTVAIFTRLSSFIFAVILRVFSRAGKMTGSGAVSLRRWSGSLQGRGPSPTGCKAECLHHGTVAGVSTPGTSRRSED